MATPVPVAPPPTMRMSNSSLFSRFFVSARGGADHAASPEETTDFMRWILPPAASHLLGGAALSC